MKGRTRSSEQGGCGAAKGHQALGRVSNSQGGLGGQEGIEDVRVGRTWVARKALGGNDSTEWPGERGVGRVGKRTGWLRSTQVTGRAQSS